MESFQSKILSYYSLSEEAYAILAKAPSFSSLPDISSNEEVKKAITGLKELKEKGKRILIYGDYDCDGVSASSILLRSFRRFGLKAEAYLPSRYLDGYGLTLKNALRAAKAGYSAIFTADNGVTAVEAIQGALDNGLDVYTLDHHEYTDRILGVKALIHPKTMGLLDPEVSAGFLAYLFSRALLKEDDPYMASLAGLSTISDAMPLKKYNRDIVRIALQCINEGHFPEFSLLSDKSQVDETVLSMEVIPKINAIGRLEQGSTINRLLAYFASDDQKKKEPLSLWMNEVNSRRKEITKEAETRLSLDPNAEAIIALTDLPEGLNGLLASRLLNEYGKPVAVFSQDSKDPTRLVGSLRSKEGFNILKALEGSHAQSLSGGGHSFAGGLSIDKTEFDLFKKDFLYAALKHKLTPSKKDLIPLKEEEATMANYRFLKALGPFGEGNPSPAFLLKEPIDKLAFTLDGRFLSTKLSPGVRLFSFSLGAKDFPLVGEASLSLRFSLNEWKGRLSLDLLVDELLR